jgi:hypothetical protein
MYLYGQEFGLTELRVYTTVFMFWISVVLVLFVLIVLRGLRERFAFGALVAGSAAILAVNAMNPDALIARTNIERARHGEALDDYYLTTLSADAMPVLVEALPRIGDRRLEPDYTLERALLDRWAGDQIDRRTWTLAARRPTGSSNLASRAQLSALPTLTPDNKIRASHARFSRLSTTCCG